MSPMMSTSCLRKATCHPGKVSISKTTHHDPNKGSVLSLNGIHFLPVFWFYFCELGQTLSICCGLTFGFRNCPTILKIIHVFGWLIGHICQFLIMFLFNLGFSISTRIRKTMGYNLFFTWVPPKPHQSSQRLWIHRKTRCPLACLPFSSHTSQQIYHLGSLGFQESPGQSLQ